MIANQKGKVAGCYAFKANEIVKPPRTRSGERERVRKPQEKIEADEQAAKAKYPKQVTFEALVDSDTDMGDIEISVPGPAAERLVKPTSGKRRSNKEMPTTQELSNDLDTLLQKPAPVPRSALSLRRSYLLNTTLLVFCYQN
ncbi:hypothetical protein K3495_g12059 [Podosphaera aphanis]|nr:hypothetical protein K3495_g12059 [Podosphaera aphanis]